MAFVCEMALAMHLLRSLIQNTRTTRDLKNYFGYRNYGGFLR